MNRLLNAGLKRLIRDKFFWIGLIAIIAFGVLGCISQYNNMIEYKIEVKSESFIFGSASIIGIFLAIFTCLFVGTDYSDGTIRNKLIIGHTRKSVYFSNLTINAISGLIINAIFMIVVTVISVTLFGPVKLAAYTYIWLIIDLIFLTVAYSSIFNMITLTCSNKAVSVVISLLLVFGLMMVSASILDKLQATEYVNTMRIVDGESVFETIKNSRYLEGNARKIHQFAVDFIPTGQGFQITGLIAPNIKILAVYSLIISLIFNTIGCFIFSKKDLK